MTDPGASAHVVDTIDRTIRGARAFELDEVAARLGSVRELVTATEVVVHVVGEFKQGKSSLVNAILTESLCPVDDDLSTSVPTEARHAPGPCALARFAPAVGADGEGWAEPIPPAEVGAHVSEAGNPGNERRLVRVTVGLDHPLLADGLVLVDTPGVGGLGSVDHAIALSRLPRSSAVLFVSDASQELTAAELAFLRTVVALCPRVVLVLTKTDLHHRWADVLARDEELLAQAGLALEILPVSADTRMAAAARGDQALNAEAGFPPLVGLLHGLTVDSRTQAIRIALRHLDSALNEIATVASGRRVALAGPDGPGATPELEAAVRAARELRERLATWQNQLQEGFLDASGAVEADMRDRARALLREAEAAIEAGDPAQNWEAFEAWLRGRLVSAARENEALLSERVGEVLARLAQRLEDEGAARPDRAGRAVIADVLDGLVVGTGFQEVRAKRMTMAVFQKSYSGYMMFTMLTHLASLALPGPVGLLAAAVMGRSGLREERSRALERRRSEAAAAVRRFVDDAIGHYGRVTRSALQDEQRIVRDRWTARVEELDAAAQAAVAQARTGVDDEQARHQALIALDEDDARLRALRARVLDLRRHLARTDQPGR